MNDVLKVEVEPLGKNFVVNRPVAIRVRFTNISSCPMRFPRRIEEFHRCFRFEVGTRGALMSNDLDDQFLPAISFPAGEDFYKILRPEEQFSCDYDVCKYFDKPGEYDFRVIFEAKSGFGLTLKHELEWKNVEQHEFYSNWSKVVITESK